jgi:hypothetical protein
MQAATRCLAVAACALSSLPAYAAEPNWTALTLANDGAWGAAISAVQALAIAHSVRDCRAKSARTNDCGALLATIRDGWILGILCGDYKIVVAERTVAAAQDAALRREIELRTLYVPNLPSCRRVVTIDPAGRAIRPTVDSRPLLSRSTD